MAKKNMAKYFPEVEYFGIYIDDPEYAKNWFDNVYLKNLLKENESVSTCNSPKPGSE